MRDNDFNNNDSGDDVAALKGDRTALRRGVFLALWAGFVGYAFLLAPGGSEASKALDMALLKQLLASPFSPEADPLFVAVFNSLGIMPAVYTLLLLPGSRHQSLPAWPFTTLSFFLGFFAMGPYLALRAFQPFPAPPEWPIARGAVESKVLPALLLAAALFLGYYGGSTISASPDALPAFLSLFKSQMLVHVSTLDLAVLSLAILDPMREDMLRRDWFSPTRLLAFASVPVAGPCLYLLLRPALPDTTKSD